MKLLICLTILLLQNNAFSQNIGVETGLEIPRFVSLKSNETNIRVGPSKNYPILLTFIKENYPVVVVDEYNEWRKIKDFKDNSGWLHKSLIKGERNGIILSLNKKKVGVFNTISGKKIGEISEENIVNIKKCKVSWCLIQFQKYKGWVNKKYIWGVKSDEIFNVGIFQYFIDIHFRILNYFEELFIK